MNLYSLEGPQQDLIFFRNLLSHYVTLCQTVTLSVCMLQKIGWHSVYWCNEQNFIQILILLDLMYTEAH